MNENGLSENPWTVLIGGVDRSGTTMLGALLGNHSKAICVPESQFKRNIISQLFEDETLSKDEILELLLQSFRYRIWGLPEKAVKAKLPETIQDEYWFLKCASLYRTRYFPHKTDNTLKFVVDHTPSNIRNIRLYEQYFSNVKFIHIVRDGRGVAKSIMARDSGPNTILNSTAFWSERLSYGLAAEQYLSRKLILRIRFEDLLSNTREIMQKICDFLHMEFEEKLIGTTDYTGPSYTQKTHELVGKPPQEERAQAWKKELTSREIELFESRCGELLEHFGYERMYPNTVAIPTRLERWGYYWYEIMMKIIDKIRYQLRRKNVS